MANVMLQNLYSFYVVSRAISDPLSASRNSIALKQWLHHWHENGEDPEKMRRLLSIDRGVVRDIPAYDE